MSHAQPSTMCVILSDHDSCCFFNSSVGTYMRQFVHILYAAVCVPWQRYVFTLRGSLMITARNEQVYERSWDAVWMPALFHSLCISFPLVLGWFIHRRMRINAGILLHTLTTSRARSRLQSPHSYRGMLSLRSSLRLKFTSIELVC